jgi:HD superfamily phosphohydrolase YqeK
MTTLERIVYLADMIEPSRDYDGVELLRKLAEEDLSRAMVAAFDQSIAHVIHGRGLLHPNTILARNELLMNER